MVTPAGSTPDPQGIEAYFLALQEQLAASLGFTRVIPHPVGMGDEAEGNWVEMLAAHLPYRYQVVDKCFVVDYRGACSQEIDIVLCDRQYTTLIFRAGARVFVPAEAVYAVFEVKQRVNRDHVLYAADKVQSVRSLARTSGAIVHAGGVIDPPTDPKPIIGGLLTTGTDWASGLTEPFVTALRDQPVGGRLDLGCVVAEAGWEVTYETDPTVSRSVREHALVHFYLRLLAALQRVGTVPAMDFARWSEFLREVDLTKPVKRTNADAQTTGGKDS